MQKCWESNVVLFFWMLQMKFVGRWKPMFPSSTMAANCNFFFLSRKPVKFQFLSLSAAGLKFPHDKSVRVSKAIVIIISSNVKSWDMVELNIFLKLHVHIVETCMQSVDWWVFLFVNNRKFETEDVREILIRKFIQCHCSFCIEFLCLWLCRIDCSVWSVWMSTHYFFR